MVITGSDFEFGATVTIGGNPATSVVVVSSTKITCVTPAHAAGRVSVTVTNLDGASGILANGFLYVGSTHADTPLIPKSVPPKDTDLAPNTKLTGDGREIRVPLAPHVIVVLPGEGPVLGGTATFVVGENFIDGATLTFDGTTTPYTYINSNALRCFTPPHAAGAVDVVVTNADTQTGTLVEGFLYQEAAATLTKIVPDEGLTSGSTSVTLYGTNLQSAPAILMGGTAVSSPTVTNAQTASFSTPAHTKGVVDIELVNPT